LGRIEDVFGNITTITTDRLGRVVEHADADTGVQTYQHTAFGEPFIHEDGVGSGVARKRSYEYDAVGRLVHVTAPEGDTRYLYDTGENAMGRLVETISPWEHVEQYDYQDVPVGRDPMQNSAFLESVTREIAGETFVTSYTYDNQNQLERVAYPDSAAGQGFAVRYGYDSVGNVNSVTGTSEDGGHENALFWRRDAAYQGQLTESETLGDQLKTTYTFDPENARLQSLTTGASAIDVIRDIRYIEYDDNGNLLHRTTAIREADSSELEVVDEGFGYDELDRLKTTRVGANTTSLVIDEIGNILSKPGVGAYVYLEDGKVFRPHAVQSVRRSNVKVLDHQYDDFGNLSLRSGEYVAGGSQEIEHTSFNLPSVITFGDGRQLRYEYDASERRVWESIGDCAGLSSCSERIYVGDDYQREVGGGPAGSFVRDVYKVMLGARLLAEVTREQRANDESEERRFVHGDALGSPQVITDKQGTVMGSRRYSPFGERLDESGNGTSIALKRDFTGHDLDIDTGLVNMRGRLYDPVLGRFLQADPPAMESPFEGQGLNRYAYVSNNPIVRTDPSGFQEAETWSVFDGPPETWSTDGNGALCYGVCGLSQDELDRNAAGALWAEISSYESAQAADTGNPHMDLIGMPAGPPSPLQLDMRPSGTGDRYNPYDYHKYGTSLFGQEKAPPSIMPAAREFIYEASPFSDVEALIDPKASAGRKVVAAVGLLPLGKLLKIGKVALAAKEVQIVFGELDDLGRATGATAHLTADAINTGSRVPSNLRPAGFLGRQGGHARGHLLGAQLGGTGKDARNVATMFTDANSPTMRGFENQVRAALEAGETVRYQAIPIYNGADLVPRGITLQAVGSGGLQLNVTVLNIP
jgi:RHS repeat-associated protein